LDAVTQGVGSGWAAALEAERSTLTISGMLHDEPLWARSGRARHAELYEAEFAKQLERIERIRSEVTAALPEPPVRDEPPSPELPPAETPARPRWDSAPSNFAATLRVVRPSLQPRVPAPAPASTPRPVEPTARARGGARLRWAVLAGASVAALAGGAAMLGGRTHESPGWTAFQVPGRPSGLVAAGGQVWITGPTAGAVWVLDGATGRMATSALALGGAPAGLALDARYAWIADTQRDWLVRAPRRGFGTLRKLRSGPGVTDVIVAAGAVWTASSADGTVRVFDPATRRQRSLRAGARPVAMATDGRHVVAADAAGTLLRFDARSRAPAGPPVLLGGAPVDVALAGDRAWIVDGGAGTVRGVDVVSGRRHRPERVCRVPVAVVADVAALYVLCRGDRTLVRLDPRTGDVRSKVALPQTPTALALDMQHIWIAAGPNEVIRVDR
jgi:streptogramin lyase